MDLIRIILCGFRKNKFAIAALLPVRQVSPCIGDQLELGGPFSDDVRSRYNFEYLCKISIFCSWCLQKPNIW